MSLATALLNQLEGDSEDDFYEDDDYFDEDCEEFYSPYAPPPPIAPEPEPIPEIEIIPTTKPIKMVLCDICQIEIPKTVLATHLTSKKHRSSAVDQKLNQIQEEAKKKARLEYLKAKELHDQVFVTKILEKIFCYAPSNQLLHLRRVCQTFKNYLDLPENWM